MLRNSTTPLQPGCTRTSRRRAERLQRSAQSHIFPRHQTREPHTIVPHGAVRYRPVNQLVDSLHGVSDNGHTLVNNKREPGSSFRKAIDTTAGAHFSALVRGI